MTTRTGWFDGDLPRVIAHRGLTFGPGGVRLPENSLAAFGAALDVGATHLETDARATADGHAVLVHDPATPEGRAINSLTLRALRGLQPDVCTFAEALASFPDARFNLDVKSRDAVQPVIRAIVAASAQDRVLVTSFASRRRRPAVRALRPIATSGSAGVTLLALLGARVGLRGVTARAVASVDALQVPRRVLGIATGRTAIIDRLHAAGVEVHIWVVNDPEQMRALVAAGVDGIVTDRADVAVASLTTT